MSKSSKKIIGIVLGVILVVIVVGLVAVMAVSYTHLTLPTNSLV